MDRYGRQVKLAEVGASGQARIALAVVEVRLDGPAADVAARYLAGAGVSAVRVRDPALAEGARALTPTVRVEVESALPVDADRESFGLCDRACIDLAQGAHVALLALRAALDGTSVSPEAWSQPGATSPAGEPRS